MNKFDGFYLGKLFNPTSKNVEEKPLVYDSKYLTTHVVCVGMTGSGKTGLGIVLLEEAALNGIPALIIDPKGDMGNLLLAFPDFKTTDFEPWIDESEALRNNQTKEQLAESTAKKWKDGLAKWGENSERVKKFKDSVEMAIYTPASQAGIPLSILNSFQAPPEEILNDEEATRDRVSSITSSLLGLLGINADPIKSREHILISSIFKDFWGKKTDLNLSKLIQAIQTPPFEKVGVFDTETFYPKKDRLDLAMKFNNLLASPTFQAWMEGEPLDIQQLLYTKEGKPRLAILTIAHLSDSERMFFVTLLLNQLLGWMRKQSGTSSLRALLYMDEIFGYFPPTAMPPSKTPMLNLLKQGRAFGLGVMLSTQNPVDLDYKGLSNCGTWFIGKLQTERDKARLLEGLSTSSESTIKGAALDSMIAATGNRVFILRSVYLKEPILFESRWTMSYLSGPLTQPQIRLLMNNRWNKDVTKQKPEVLKPSLPSGIDESYLISNSLPNNSHFSPYVLGKAKLHFVDSKNNLDEWREYAYATSLNQGIAQWNEAQDLTLELKNLSQEAPTKAEFEPLSAALLQVKNYPIFSKTFLDFLYQSQTLQLFLSKDTKLVSKNLETEEAFRQRVSEILLKNAQDEIKKIEANYTKKIQTLTDRLDRAQEKERTQKSKVNQQWFDTVVGVGATVLNAFLGKKMTKGAISDVGTTIRKAGRISKDQGDADRVQESLEQIQQQIQAARDEQNSMIQDYTKKMQPDQITLETISVKPRKSDITIENVSVVWMAK